MIICTTSDRYHHILPVLLYLYKKYWNEPFILLGYEKPSCPLPDNCTFVSMGVQGPVSEWSTDIRAYIESAGSAADWFVWLMEDTLLREPVDDTIAWALCMPTVGRVNLTSDVSKREHMTTSEGVLWASPGSRYRLSTQPSIWNRKYLLQYLTNGLTPWDFETQDPKNDGWQIAALAKPPVVHNEGVTRRDIYKLDLAGLAQEDIDHIKTITDQWPK